MIYDSHLHTEFSGDSSTPARIQIERAISLGMKEMCITDHHDYDSDFCDCNFVLDIPAYIAALKQLQEEYKNRIHINIGIELGLQRHLKAYLEDFSKTYGQSFDFIIGSSHFVDSMDPYEGEYWEKYGQAGGLAAFFEVSSERVKQLNYCFDSFGHLDYAVRYMPQRGSGYSYQAYSQWIDPILKTLIENGKALECNTGGIRYGLGTPNPCTDILIRYRQLGGELITVGSDAHTTTYVGCGFDQCRELLQHCGFRYYAVYHERKPLMISL